MAARLPIVAGLVAGVVVGALLFVAIVAFAPEPGSAGATPSVPPANPSPGTSAAGTQRPVTPPASGDASPTTGGLFHIGEQAPELVVPQVGGGTIDLAALRGKPVWINFMATWCPPCRDEFPAMSRFATTYADTGLVVLAIDVKEEEGAVAAFAESLGANFPLGLDLDGAAQQRWGAVALPVHFWVDAQGVVRDGALGGIGPDIMAAGLQTILPDVEVSP
jgi:cytochrome c biogenesis protein CcmG, thiol:disulfide interchange protein DsbE